MKKLKLLIVFAVISNLIIGQGLDSRQSLSEDLSMLNLSAEFETAAIPEKTVLPTDLEIINLIGSYELSSLEYTLDTMGLQFNILEKVNGRYVVDIEGVENNIKSWEIATTPNGTDHEWVAYVLIRYYHDNSGDLADFERYETNKRVKKINERKFTYNKSLGKKQSYIAVKITD